MYIYFLRNVVDLIIVIDIFKCASSNVFVPLSAANSVQDVTWRLVDDENCQDGPLIELDFQLKGTVESGAQSFSTTAQPAKLQTLLYGKRESYPTIITMTQGNSN